MTLKELAVGQSGIIEKIDCEAGLRRRLLDMGLTPKTSVTLNKTAPMGDPLELFLRGYALSIRAGDAEKIILREQK